MAVSSAAGEQKLVRGHPSVQQLAVGLALALAEMIDADIGQIRARLVDNREERARDMHPTRIDEVVGLGPGVGSILRGQEQFDQRRVAAILELSLPRVGTDRFPAGWIKIGQRGLDNLDALCRAPLLQRQEMEQFL